MVEKIKKAIKWIAIDGLLHILVCYAIMLAFKPLVGTWLTLVVTIFFATAKELWDYFVERDNNLKQVIHDCICDIVGIIFALLTFLAWGIVGL